MEPLAIVVAYLAVVYIVLRGPLLVAPEAAVRLERRLMYATARRLRIFGGLLLVMYAAPLIVAARQARNAQGDVALWIETFGWFVAATAVWVIAAPGPWKRFLESFWAAVSAPPVLRALGGLGVAVGLFLGWVAFFVL